MAAELVQIAPGTKVDKWTVEKKLPEEQAAIKARQQQSV